MEPSIYSAYIPDAKLMAKGAWDLRVYITDMEIEKVITVTVCGKVYILFLKSLCLIACTRANIR